MFNTVKQTNICKLGDSSAVVLPAIFMKELNLNRKDRVEISIKDDGIFIKPLPQWSIGSQNKACQDFLKMLEDIPDDEEVIPENFAELYKFRGREFEKEMFERLED